MPDTKIAESPTPLPIVVKVFGKPPLLLTATTLRDVLAQAQEQLALREPSGMLVAQHQLFHDVDQSVADITAAIGTAAFFELLPATATLEIRYRRATFSDVVPIWGSLENVFPAVHAHFGTSPDESWLLVHDGRAYRTGLLVDVLHLSADNYLTTFVCELVELVE